MNRGLYFLSVLALTAAFSLTAFAGEQGHYVPSSWSPRDLISAPSGLKVFAPYVAFYNAQKARNGNGDTISSSQGLDVNANSWMFTPVLVYAPKYKPFGADWSITIVPAYGKAGANARLTAFEENITLFDNSNTGWGDLYVIPVNLTWQLNPHWALSIQYAFWAPVGEYDADRADNVGLGYWSHDFRGTVSFFPLGNPGLLLSASLVEEINGDKKGFDLTPASHTTAELAASMAFSERLMCGLLAGGIWETGDADGADAMEDGHDRMYNAGVEAAYWFVLGKFGSLVRATTEFGVRDRFEGGTLVAGVNFIF